MTGDLRDEHTPAEHCDVTVNGEVRVVPTATTVAALVQQLTRTTTGCAVAVNGEVVPRADWADRLVRRGDHVDVLTAVQGG